MAEPVNEIEIDVPLSTTVYVMPLIEPVEPLASTVPPIDSLSPVCLLVRTTEPDAIFVSSLSVTTASISAIATPAEFSLYVAVQPVPAPDASRSNVGATSVTVPDTVAVEVPPLPSEIVYANEVDPV